MYISSGFYDSGNPGGGLLSYVWNHRSADQVNKRLNEERERHRKYQEEQERQRQRQQQQQLNNQNKGRRNG